MIVFHTGDDARNRIEAMLENADGDTYRLQPGKRLGDSIDAISQWIAAFFITNQHSDRSGHCGNRSRA